MTHGGGGEYVTPSHILDPFHNVFETFSNTKRGEVCGDGGAADFIKALVVFGVSSVSGIRLEGFTKSLTTT